MVEVLAGAGIVLGCWLPPVRDAFPGLAAKCALAAFALTWAVTPVHYFMLSHNAHPATKPLPPAGHALRWAMQVVLLASMWGIAHP